MLQFVNRDATCDQTKKIGDKNQRKGVKAKDGAQEGCPKAVTKIARSRSRSRAGMQDGKVGKSGHRTGAVAPNVRQGSGGQYWLRSTGFYAFADRKCPFKGTRHQERRVTNTLLRMGLI